MRIHCLALRAIAVLAALCPLAAFAGDWPAWGRDASRNMVSPEKNLPDAIEPPTAGDDGKIAPGSGKNVRWVAKLGSASYGNPTVAGGRVFVGINNGTPRDPKIVGDYAILLCLDEKTGAFLWQYASPKMAAGKVNDWEEVGLCSSPAIDGDRCYFVSNHCQVVCLSADKGAVVWQYDMRNELGAFPRNQASSAVLIVGDRIYVTTSNGVDWTGKHIPSPDCPALICLDKATGKLLAAERSGISRRTWICNWSTPAYAVIAGRPTVVFGAGDGFCYGFDATTFVDHPKPTSPQDSPAPTLKELWRFDCNPPARHVKNGKTLKYGSQDGPCDVIATPIIVNDRIYVAVGQEPEQGDGAGAMNCFEPRSGAGDITETARIWAVANIGRSVSTAAVDGGLTYVSDLAGIIHCYDAATGAEVWKHDTEAHIWGAVLVADGKVYVGNENGQLLILAAGKAKKVLATIDLKEAIYSSPIAANGAVYVATAGNLYAFEVKK